MNRYMALFGVFLLSGFLMAGCASASAVTSLNRQRQLIEEIVTPEEVIGEFQTEYSLDVPARNANIELAARSIDQTVVYPGEAFSYNETLGPTTKKNGYKSAQIFIKGKKTYGYGGGVCQVSSTLYNAVDSAGLAVTERHAHSLPVDYVDEGRDAATSYGGIDFKFVNDKTFPVKISSQAADGIVDIKILKV